MLRVHSRDGGLVTKSCPTLTTPLTVACQAPLSMGLPRQEYQNGLPFPQESEPTSPALAGGFFTTAPPGKPNCLIEFPKI